MILPFMLYAEIHHKYKFIPNFLYKKEPEIIIDFPRRLEPNIKKIPFVLNVKDSNKFPILLKSITIKILTPQKKIIKPIYQGKKLINKRIYQKIFWLENTFNLKGDYPVIAEITYMINNKTKIIENHNYKKVSKSLWHMNFSDNKLPAYDNWYCGDIHWHSIYTEDDVEFGQSLENAKELAKAGGLYFLGVTDHSYDLDDIEGKYRQNDKDLNKWKSFKKEVELRNNRTVDFVFLPGEEVSAGNIKNKNIHVLLFNNKKFIKGTGDSTDKPFKNKPDNKLKDFQHEIPFKIAAHPYEGYGLLPKLFLNRGKWEDKDFQFVDGIQFYNGKKNKGYYKGKSKWIEFLLKGEKIFTYAGTDAHGDFNTAIKVKIPFLKLVKCNKQITGRVKTYVYSKKRPNKNILIKNLKSGKCFITDGPAIKLNIKTNNKTYLPGNSLKTNNKYKVSIETLSTKEFGKIKNVKLIFGNIQKNKEIIINHYNNIKSFEFNNIFEYNNKEKGFIRAEVHTDKNKTALTNPIFINY